MFVWIVLVYHSRDHECHKIPENIKQNLKSTQLNLSIMISIIDSEQDKEDGY